MKWLKAWRMSRAELILQDFRHFTYVTPHSPTLPSLYLRHNSFSNPSVASLTSQLILQPFFRFYYVTEFSLTSPGEPPMDRRRSQVLVWKWILKSRQCTSWTWRLECTSHSAQKQRRLSLALVSSPRSSAFCWRWFFNVMCLSCGSISPCLNHILHFQQFRALKLMIMLQVKNPLFTSIWNKF